MRLYRNFTARARYRRAMLAAIRDASRAGVFRASSRTDGLRAIRLFEEINGVIFDPFDSYHRLLVANNGYHFALRRSLRTLTPNRRYNA